MGSCKEKKKISCITFSFQERRPRGESEKLIFNRENQILQLNIWPLGLTHDFLSMNSFFSLSLLSAANSLSQTQADSTPHLPLSLVNVSDTCYIQYHEAFTETEGALSPMFSLIPFRDSDLNLWCQASSFLMILSIVDRHCNRGYTFTNDILNSL